MRVLLIVAAAVVLLGTVVSLGVTAFGLSAMRVTKDTQPLPAAMRSLTIDTGRLPTLIRIVADGAAAEPRVDLRQVDKKQSAGAALVVTNDATGTRVTARRASRRRS